MELLGTYRLHNLTDFILNLMKKIQDEALREQWLHTQMTQSFKDFKKQQGFTEVKSISKEEQAQSLNYAYQFIKPNKPLESEVDK